MIIEHGRLAIMGEKGDSLRDLVGKRIEIPVHYDLWMQGAKYGLVTAFRNGKPGQSDYVTVRMDNKNLRHLRLWRIDATYCRVLH